MLPSPHSFGHGGGYGGGRQGTRAGKETRPEEGEKCPAALRTAARPDRQAKGACPSRLVDFSDMQPVRALETAVPGLGAQQE
jgi:hypothetical protein